MAAWLPLLDHDPVFLALGGLSLGVGRLPARDVLRWDPRPSCVSVNRTRLLRLNDDGACVDTPEVADARWAARMIFKALV